MKKNILRIITIIVVAFGLFSTGHNVFAACNNQFGEKKFGTEIQTIRNNTPNTTFKTQFKREVTKDHPDCAGVDIPGTFYHLKFSYTLFDRDDWTDVDIPDSSVKLKAGEWGTVSVTPVGFCGWNAMCEIRFKEIDEIPDILGAKKVFWIDRVKFGSITLKQGSLTDTSVELDSNVIYTNKEAQAAGKTVPGRNITIRVYKKGETKIAKEIVFNNNVTLNYNVTLPLVGTISGLDPNTEYYANLIDKSRDLEEGGYNPSVDFSFKTLKKTTTTTTTGTQNNTTGTNQNTTTNTTTTTTLTASGRQSFIASSEQYPGITMNGSLTPTVEGGDLSISGTFTYNYATVPISDITKGGSLSFHLVDGDGHTSQIIPVDVVAASEVADYNKPYFFTPGFDNYIKFLDEDGKPVSAERKAPFSLVITDDGLGMRTAKIPVVDSVTSTTITGVSQNGGMSGTDPNAANNGDGLTTTKVDFTAPTIDSPTDTSVAISAQVTYVNKSKTGAVDGENIILQVVDDTGKTAFTSGKLPIDAKYGTPVTVSTTATGLSKDKKYNARFISNPGTKQVLSPAVALAGNTDGKIGKDENPIDNKDQKQSTYGLLRNPLRSGLDSIPEIVSALVKNIVIPIAIPFLALSIIYTGFLFIQARGNKDKLEKAKEALKWTLIGGAIILASYVIATALQGTIADIIR